MKTRHGSPAAASSTLHDAELTQQTRQARKAVRAKFKYIQVPDPVQERKDVTSTDKLVFGRLYNLWRSVGKVYPSHEWLARKGGMSKSSIKQSIQRLEKLGWIKVDRATGVDRWRHQNNTYTILYQDWMGVESDANPQDEWDAEAEARSERGQEGRSGSRRKYRNCPSNADSRVSQGGLEKSSRGEAGTSSRLYKENSIKKNSSILSRRSADADADGPAQSIPSGAGINEAKTSKPSAREAEPTAPSLVKGKVPASPKVTRDTSPHHTLIAHHGAGWSLAHGGDKYPFAAAKDGSAAKSILKSLQGDLGRALRVVDAYLADDHPYYAGHPLAKLGSDIAKFMTKVPREVSDDLQTDSTAPNNDPAAEPEPESKQPSRNPWHDWADDTLTPDELKTFTSLHGGSNRTADLTAAAATTFVWSRKQGTRRKDDASQWGLVLKDVNGKRKWVPKNGKISYPPGYAPRG